MKDGQHLHNAIGNAVGECKKRLFERLKESGDIETQLARFIAELELALETAIREQ